MSKEALIILLAISFLIVGACTAQDSVVEDEAYIVPGAEEADIVDTLTASGNFNTLLITIQDAGLTDTFKGPGPFTIFAPTDDAFAMVPQAYLDALLVITTDLTDLLTYHVIREEITSGDLRGRSSLEAMNGQNLAITVSGNEIMVEGARVVQPDVEATNGVILVIDSVLMPAQVIET